MVPVIVIDAKNRPEAIPLKHWIKEGEEVHITLITFHPFQEGGVQGCELFEKPLPLEECAPYNFWKLSRFGIKEENIEALIQLVKDSTELNEVDVRKLIKESELQTV